MCVCVFVRAEECDEVAFNPNPELSAENLLVMAGYTQPHTYIHTQSTQIERDRRTHKHTQFGRVTVFVVCCTNSASLGFAEEWNHKTHISRHGEQ